MSQFYACQHTDETLRKKSSSGGVFSALAEYIIQQGGIVYGAAFSQDFRSVRHICISSKEELHSLRGPKYISSRIGTTYKEIKELLGKGILVLFSGTPCQIAGLRRQVGDDKNLFCIDIVCHGVADHTIYEHYLNYLSKKYQSDIQSFSFRDKTTSWRHSDVVIHFQNGEILREPGAQNAFMRGFISNLYIREACTRCHFKSFTSGSDMTIGDFWGATEIPQLVHDDTGISIVAIHSEKGEKLFQLVSDKLTSILELSEQEAFVFNESYKTSATSHRNTDTFYAHYKDSDFNELIDKLLFQEKKKESLVRKYLYKLKNTIRKYAHS